MSKSNVCIICDHVENSQVDMTKHIMNDHTITERIDALQERCWVEDTNQ